MTERRCEVLTYGPHPQGVQNPCGALIVEGRCRKLRGTGATFPCDHLKWVHEDGHAIRLRDQHPYDGYECEAGHPVAAEVVA